MKRLSTVFICLLLVAALSVTAFAANFTDVPSNAYYADAVNWAVSNGLISGTSSTKFSPDQGCTRAMFVTVLDRYRKYLDGGQILDVYSCPVGQEPTPFTDVNPGAWYYESVVWAYNNGIASGTSATLFSPNATLSRQDACLFVYRFAKMNDWHGTSTEDEINRGTAIFNNYTDKGQISSYAYDAMAWALEYGMISGTDPTTLAPRSTITRAQMVSFFYRLGCVASVHDYGAAQTVAPTCTKGGYDVRTCTKCGMKQYSNIVSPLGHNYSSKKTDSKYLASAATCQVPASYYYSCSRCGAKGTSTFTSGSKINHDYRGYSVSLPSKTGGKVTYSDKCIMCGATKNTRTYGESAPNPKNMTNPNKNAIAYNSNGVWQMPLGVDDATGIESITIRRFWFGKSWVYVADTALNSQGYDKFKSCDSPGTWVTRYTQNLLKPGESSYKDYISQGKNVVSKANEKSALVMMNGDLANYEAIRYRNSNNQIVTDNDGRPWPHLRSGTSFEGSQSRSAGLYYNANDGTFGSMGKYSGYSLDQLVSQKLATDTIHYYGTCISGGIPSKSNTGDKRQGALIGFKRDGSITHVYFVVYDGLMSSSDSSSKSDGQSYGLDKNGPSLLMSYLGCEYAMMLDHGGSAGLAVYANNKYVTLNNAAAQEGQLRGLWDYFYIANNSKK